MTDPSHHPQLMRLLTVIAQLRAPGGCPWDREQTEASMAPHLLEEAYEAVDALAAADRPASCEELGDVLMNVLMIAQISSEAGRYDVEDVARGIADKLIRRHPHVFGDSEAKDTDAVLANWEAIKRREGKGKGKGKGDNGRRSAFAGVPRDLPALLRAFRVGEKAARTGFDWPDARGPRNKLDEELAEFDQALASGDPDAAAAELGRRAVQRRQRRAPRRHQP